MKNLANCKPSEFLVQTNKIRKAVDKWLTDTDIMNIRSRLPEVKEDMTADQVEQAKVKQMKANFNAILDAMLDEHPDETLEVLALICFVEPKDFDNHSVSEYLASISEVLNNEAVIGFFTSLAQWGSMNGLNVARV